MLSQRNEVGGPHVVDPPKRSGVNSSNMKNKLKIMPSQELVASKRDEFIKSEMTKKEKLVVSYITHYICYDKGEPHNLL